MSAKVHLHMHVSDLTKSREFYQKFLGADPVKVKPGYVKFLPEWAPVNLALSTGAVRWEASGRPGTVAAGEGALVLHEEGGTVWSIDPATGATRWKVDSGVPGTLPAALYKDAVVVAGHGLSVLQAATGAARWSAPDVVATTLPLAWGPWLLTGEADGGLHCRDLATGAALWTYATPHPLLAPPVVDAEGRVLLGTTDRRFVSLDARGKGHERWRWKVGADVQAPPGGVNWYVTTSPGESPKASTGLLGVVLTTVASRSGPPPGGTTCTSEPGTEAAATALLRPSSSASTWSPADGRATSRRRAKCAPRP